MAAGDLLLSPSRGRLTGGDLPAGITPAGVQDYLYFHELDKAYQDGRISDLSYHEIQEKVRALTENPYGQVNLEDLEDIRWSIGDLLDAGRRKKSPWGILFRISM